MTREWPPYVPPSAADFHMVPVAPQLDYQAIADELRSNYPPPTMTMNPGDYMDSLGIHRLADAIESVGRKKQQEGTS